MSQPAVQITELDGAVGILPETQGRILAIVGPSSSGPTDTPATFARKSDVVANYERGPLVEAAAYALEKYGRPVCLVRTGQSVAGSYPAAAAHGGTVTGTSTVTVDNGGTEPDDDYECYFIVITGGTIGTAGITFQWSLDGGRTLSPVTALGTANSFVFPDSGGIGIDFAAGTLVAGDLVTFRADAPNWNASEIGDALDALFASNINWEICQIVGPIDGTTFDTIDPKFTGAIANGKFRSWVGHARMPNLAETEAAYLTALDGIFSAKATVHGELCAGAAKTSSGVSGRSYRRPPSFAIAPLQQVRSEEKNIAEINGNALPGLSIRDSNGNADEHDESINPGLDDSRFTVLRTWVGYAGVYVNRSRIFSAAGSDFFLHTHRRVLNLAHAALRAYFTRRLSKPVLVDATTGFILEEEAREIEAAATAALKAVLSGGPKASGWSVTISRTDNLLSTKTLTGDARVIPLAYPEFINIELGFINPALQVVAA